MPDRSNTTPHRRLIYDLDKDRVTFDPPLPMPFADEQCDSFDEMMAALAKFREAIL